MDGVMNPWCLDDKIYKSLNDVCVLAEKNRVARKKKLINETETNLEEKFPSLELIKFLQSANDSVEVISKITFEIQQRSQDKESADILHSNQIQQRIAMISNFTDHLKSLVQEKQTLLTALQRPLVENSIKLELKHHEPTMKMFSQVSSILRDLVKNLNNIEWLVNADLASPNKLEEALSFIESNLACLQTCYLRLNQVNNNMEELKSFS
ncbi:unnamed protein product [Acanthosepion pharaonis]|uniref:Uncharacterized protein n=1 Tax=Acanthosepion pharaonis TaxID=158019 RepID=A0A812DNE1_ACAPH|nr:unnamed protein product [Sepia pharaonis]